MNGRADWHGRCESSIHDHDIALWVTMVGWVDVPDNDQGDFRRQCAIDVYLDQIGWEFL